MEQSETQTPRFDRRHDSNVQQITTIVALVITICVNIVTVTWTVARLSASIESLEKIVSPLVTATQSNTNDISVLKDRANRGRP